ncbi:MAG: hypothetical protein MZV65_28285 [Chromatiales bacterium]|nr:hypothetical protein [Chromatiales bacterium]
MTGKQINTYNTRTAWSLARAHAITGERRFLDAAVRNGEWALTQAQPNGWLANNCLQDNEQPFTHTIAYAMRGLLEIGAYAQREDLLNAARRIGDGMLNALPANGKLPGRFGNQWQPTVTWSCLTGDCQLGINWGRLYQLTGEQTYREATARVLSFVKRTQRLDGDDPDTRGGIKGSHPINGGYHPWQYPNWATKFYADALMMDEAMKLRTQYVINAINGCLVNTADSFAPPKLTPCSSSPRELDMLGGVDVVVDRLWHGLEREKPGTALIGIQDRIRSGYITDAVGRRFLASQHARADRFIHAFIAHLSCDTSSTTPIA